MSPQYEMPKLGSKVRITTSYKNYVLYDSRKYIETTYEGTVGSAHKLLAPNSFVLNTPNTPQFTKREINLAYVASLEYIDGTKAKKTVNKNQTWEVKGSKGDHYIVTRTHNQFTCSCVGFQFRRKCKHINMII